MGGNSKQRRRQLLKVSSVSAGVKKSADRAAFGGHRATGRLSWYTAKVAATRSLSQWGPASTALHQDWDSPATLGAEYQLQGLPTAPPGCSFPCFPLNLLLPSLILPPPEKMLWWRKTPGFYTPPSWHPLWEQPHSCAGWLAAPFSLPPVEFIVNKAVQGRGQGAAGRSPLLSFFLLPPHTEPGFCLEFQRDLRDSTLVSHCRKLEQF